MQRIRRSTFPLFIKQDFKGTKHNFKGTKWFLKICKIFDKLSRPQIKELLPHYGRKNLATTIFFEQRIKKSLILDLITTFGRAVCCILLLLVLL